MKREPTAPAIRALLTELMADRVRIYTSILTLQEISVSAFAHGGSAGTDRHALLSRMARIVGVNRDVAMRAAQYEAAVIAAAKQAAPKADVEDNRRRKFDCFHLATAVTLGCSTFYTFDKKFNTRCDRLGLGIQVREPQPRKPKLQFEGA